MTVGDVPGGKPCGSLKGIVLYLRPVMGFIPVTKAFKDKNGVVNARFLDMNGLKTSLKGGVLFDMLPVFVQRSGPDDLKLSPGKTWLENVAASTAPSAPPLRQWCGSRR